MASLHYLLATILIIADSVRRDVHITQQHDADAVPYVESRYREVLGELHFMGIPTSAL